MSLTFTALRNVARRSRVMSAAVTNTQKRNMALGGHHGPPPEWKGIDKIVRSYLPEDYQLSAAILSGYFGAFVLYKLFSAIGGGSKAAAPAEEAAAAPAKAAPATGGVPDVDSPEFETFVGSEAFIKVLENEEQLMGWIKKAEA